MRGGLERPHPMGAFLRYLATFPRPETIASVLARGPLAMFAARTANVMVADGDDLVIISGYGFDVSERVAYRHVSSNIELPIARAFRTNSLLISDTATLFQDYAAISMVDQVGELLAGLGDADVVSVPIECQGVPIGALGFICAKPEEWTAEAYGLIDGICSALALWMSNPLSGVQASVRLMPRQSDSRMRLDDRQIEILLLVEQGMSTTQITQELRVSDSTVKKSLQRAMQALRVENRVDAVHKAREVGLLS